MTDLLLGIFRLIGLLLFDFYGWVIVLGVLGLLIWQNRRQRDYVASSDTILLLVEVPKDNDKKELAAEQMFASLHGILRPKSELRREGALQEHISFEIASVGNKIQFYVWTPRHLKDFVEGQIYAQYPSVHIREGAEDYTRAPVGDREVYGTELVLTRNDVLPIKTFVSFEVDPLAGITAVLSKLDQPGEEMWVQILARPLDDSWQNQGLKFIEKVKSGRGGSLGKDFLQTAADLPLHLVTNFINGLVAPPESADKKKDGGKAEVSTGQQTMIKAVEEKITKLGYEVKVRITYLGPEPTLAKQRLQAILGGFKQFNSTNLNGFTSGKMTDKHDLVEDYRARLFLGKGSILNIEELASLYHLPHTTVETPNMVWTTVKTGEPPANLPTDTNTERDDISLFGLTNFRGTQQKFGLKRVDRGRHLYIVGQTGTGKSMLMQLLTLSDLYQGHGVAVIDPHGDYATEIMRYIPKDRLDDVIYFNVADREFPIAFNPLEVTDPDMKNHIASEMVGVLKRMFVDSWGPRLEHILRYTVLALLDYPDATMLGITRMLTEKEFRKDVIAHIDDPVVRHFWVHEFASWNDKFASEAVAPVLNKVGAFTSNPIIRNIIGQPKSAVGLRRVMDEGKILLVNLSRGQVGEDNSAVLGALMVTKLQLAAMSRANVVKEERRPFYLYVDEFQNFATDSFAVILSEARKYALNLTVANQYISQMPEVVRSAVFGNVGSMISFRVGAEDAPFLAKYFAPTFLDEDLVKLHNQAIFVSMSIDGEKSPSFSANTLRMPDPEADQSDLIIEQSRKRYASARDKVSQDIAEWTHGGNRETTEAAPAPAQAEQKANFISGLKNPDLPSSAPNHRPQHSNQGNRRPHHKGGQRDDRSQQEANRSNQPQAPKGSPSSGLKADESVELRR